MTRIIQAFKSNNGTLFNTFDAAKYNNIEQFIYEKLINYSISKEEVCVEHIAKILHKHSAEIIEILREEEPN